VPALSASAPSSIVRMNLGIQSTLLSSALVSSFCKVHHIAKVLAIMLSSATPLFELHTWCTSTHRRLRISLLVPVARVCLTESKFLDLGNVHQCLSSDVSRDELHGTFFILGVSGVHGRMVSVATLTPFEVQNSSRLPHIARDAA